MENDLVSEKIKRDKNVRKFSFYQNSQEFHIIIQKVDEVIEERIHTETRISKTKHNLNQINNDLLNANSRLNKIDIDISKDQVKRLITKGHLLETFEREI